MGTRGQHSCRLASRLTAWAVVLVTVCTGATVSHAGSSLLDQILAIDGLVLESNTDGVESRFEALAGRLDRCPQGAGDRVDCALDALFGQGGLRATGNDADPDHNTVTETLKGESGSCAALVATALALAEPAGIPLEAVVYRDHVRLGEPGSGREFETLQRGQLVAPGEAPEVSMPGGPVTVDGVGFLPYYLDNLAARLVAVGRTKEAEAAFETGLRRWPRVARLHYNYGTLLLHQGRWKEARGRLSRAIRLGWDDADAFSNRGVAQWQLGNPKAAKNDFTEALRLQPHHREAASNLRRIEEGHAPSLTRVQSPSKR